MSKLIIIEGNSNDKDNVRNFMVKGEPGNDGVSPTVKTSKTGSTATINITDATGVHSVDIKDGFTPTVTATKEDGVTTIEITNEDGTETTEINDGVDLTGGVPTNGVIAFTGDTIPNGYEETNIVDLIYPIGSIYMSVNNTNPSTLFGGTWVSWGNGKVPVGVDTTDTNFDTVEKTGGEATHTLTLDEIPSHAGHLTGNAGGVTGQGNALKKWLADSNMYTGTVNQSFGWDFNSNEYYPHNVNRGGGQSHNNLQPYITCYMWKRTA